MRRLTGEDNSYLAWESATQPQHTIKVMVLDPARGHQPITVDAVRAALPGLVERAEPLRWQLLTPRLRFGRPWWLPRSGVDVGYHLRHAVAAAPGGDRELGAVIDALLVDRLDRARPLWQLYYVDGLAGGRIALVWKIHHSVADGLASRHLLETFCGTDPAAALPGGPAAPVPDPRRPVPPAWSALARHQRLALTRFPRVVARTARVSATMIRRRRAGKPGYAAAFSAPGVRFNAPLTPGRRFAFRACDVNAVKQVARAFEVTVNDVFLAVCSAALRGYLDRHGGLPAESLTAVVPVSLRSANDDPWGNNVARWNVALATDVADPVARLRAIAAATRTAREVQAERDVALQHDWMEYWPLFWFYSRALPLIGERTSHRPTFSLIASNVKGPQQLFFGGAPVERLISSGPLVFPMGLNFTGWSYDGALTVGVMACGDHIADPWEIADGLPAAFAELAERAGVSAGAVPVEQGRRRAAAGADIQPSGGDRV